MEGGVQVEKAWARLTTAEKERDAAELQLHRQTEQCSDVERPTNSRTTSAAIRSDHPLLFMGDAFRRIYLRFDRLRGVSGPWRLQGSHPSWHPPVSFQKVQGILVEMDPLEWV